MSRLTLIGVLPFTERNVCVRVMNTAKFTCCVNWLHFVINWWQSTAVLQRIIKIRDERYGSSSQRSSRSSSAARHIILSGSKLRHWAWHADPFSWTTRINTKTLSSMSNDVHDPLSSFSITSASTADKLYKSLTTFITIIINPGLSAHKSSTLL